jgi:hypoxanthine-guanine phosphoribosyltransferase
MSAELLKSLLPEFQTDLKVITVTSDNIDTLPWDCLDWLPYFDGSVTFGPCQSSELLPHEQIDILIPAQILNTRIAAAINAIEAQMKASIQPWAIGAVLNAGLPLYQDVLRLLSPNLRSRLTTNAHIDIKSRRGTNIQNQGYQINQMPDPSLVNDRRFLICESVVDTGQTLRLIDHQLTNPCYRRVQPLGLLIVDKNSAHPDVKLPFWVLPSLFRVHGDIWVSGHGMDVDGRFRSLPDVVAYRRV